MLVVSIRSSWLRRGVLWAHSHASANVRKRYKKEYFVLSWGSLCVCVCVFVFVCTRDRCRSRQVAAKVGPNMDKNETQFVFWNLLTFYHGSWSRRVVVCARKCVCVSVCVRVYVCAYSRSVPHSAQAYCVRRYGDLQCNGFPLSTEDRWQRQRLHMMPVAGWRRCVPKRDVIEDVHLSIPQRSESVRRSLGFYTWSRGLNRPWQEALTYVLHPEVCALDTCAHGILRMKSAQVSSHRPFDTRQRKQDWTMSLCNHIFVCVCVCVCVCLLVGVPEDLFQICTRFGWACRWPTVIVLHVITNICLAVVAMNMSWLSKIVNSHVLCILIGRSFLAVSCWGKWAVSHLYWKDKHLPARSRIIV